MTIKKLRKAIKTSPNIGVDAYIIDFNDERGRLKSSHEIANY